MSLYDETRINKAFAASYFFKINPEIYEKSLSPWAREKG
jgi:hypothetical protein